LVFLRFGWFFFGLDWLPFLIQICKGFRAPGNFFDKGSIPSDKRNIKPMKVKEYWDNHLLLNTDKRSMVPEMVSNLFKGF
jgi:hypothetical protein